MIKTNPDELVFTTNMSYGISKREYFAALAMQNLVEFSYTDVMRNRAAEVAVATADALIKALNEGGDNE